MMTRPAQGASEKGLVLALRSGFGRSSARALCGTPIAGVVLGGRAGGGGRRAWQGCVGVVPCFGSGLRRPCGTPFCGTPEDDLEIRSA